MRPLVAVAMTCWIGACAADGPRPTDAPPTPGAAQAAASGASPAAPPSFEVADGPVFVVRANDVLLEGAVVAKVFEPDRFDPSAPWDSMIVGPLRDGLPAGPRSDPAIGHTRRCVATIDPDVRLNVLV